MTISDILNEFSKIKELIKFSDQELAKQCVTIFNDDFIYAVAPKEKFDTWRKHNNYKLLINENDLAKDLYIIRINFYFKNDIDFRIICNSELTKLISIRIIQLTDLENDKFKFYTENYDEIFEKFNEKIEFSLRFIKGNLYYKNTKNIQFLKYEKDKPNIIGIWKNDILYFDFDIAEITSNTIKNNFSRGIWTVLNDLLIITYKAQSNVITRKKEQFKFKVTDKQLFLKDIDSNIEYVLLKTDKNSILEFNKAFDNGEDDENLEFLVKKLAILKEQNHFFFQSLKLLKQIKKNTNPFTRPMLAAQYAMSLIFDDIPEINFDEAFETLIKYHVIEKVEENGEEKYKIGSNFPTKIPHPNEFDIQGHQKIIII